MVHEQTIKSLLDTDLYKLTMQAAVLEDYSKAEVSYKLNNRTHEKKFNKEAFEWLEYQFKLLGTLRFRRDEIDFLERAVPQLSDNYLKYLETFKLNPDEQLIVDFNIATGDINIEVKGLWVETIIYEIPVLALISEAYFRFVDTNWNLERQVERAEEKAIILLENECSFSEFGTRRRRSLETQDLVMQGLISGYVKYKGSDAYRSFVGLRGTSNVYFAKKYNLTPIGTVAHEWIMGIAAATQDYVNANRIAMEKWRQTMGDQYVGVALTDTFGTDAFLKSFTYELASVYAGVRQDSGDPLLFIKKIAKFYDSIGIDKSKKVIVFSDSLDIAACKKYKQATENVGMLCSFGVGTFLTNDFCTLTSPHVKSTPLNIVIKLSSVGDKPAIKISDNLGKNTGDEATVEKVKHQLGYIEREWEGGDEDKRWTSTGTLQQ
ncbi:Quinolinate phosphoribosyl transferase [Dipodascopsis uninucleata]